MTFAPYLTSIESLSFYQKIEPMKQVLFSLLMVLGISIGYAQVPGSNKKAANTNSNTNTSKEPSPAAVANELCECVNKYLSTFHPAIKQFIVDMAEKGADEAQYTLEQKVLTLSAKEQERIEADVNRLQDGGDSDQMLQCFTNMEQKYSNLSDGAFGDKVMAALEKNANCKFLVSLMKIGEDDE